MNSENYNTNKYLIVVVIRELIVLSSFVGVSSDQTLNQIYRVNFVDPKLNLTNELDE